MSRLILLAVVFLPTVTPAAEPLVKPAKPPAGFTRVRFPAMGKEDELPKLTGTVTVPPAMPRGMPTVTPVSMVVMSSDYWAIITVKRLAALGIKGEVGKPAVLPEVTLNGWASTGPVKVTLTNVQMRVVAGSFGSDDKLRGDDFWINLNQLVRSPAGQSELWMTFAEQTELAVSYPNKWVKKSDAGGEKPDAPPAPPVLGDPAVPADRVPVMLSLAPNTYTVVPQMLNGRPMPKPGGSRFEVSMTGGGQSALITFRTLTDHKLMADENEVVGDGGDGKVEKRGVAGIPKAIYAAGIGTGFKTAREIHFKPTKATVFVESDVPEFSVGSGFLRTAADAQGTTLAVGTDGVPRVYAALPKALVVDPKAKK